MVKHERKRDIKDKLVETYNKYKALFHEINFLKLMTIVSYPDIYQSFVDEASMLIVQNAVFLDYLFIDITELRTIKDYDDIFKITGDNNSISNYSKRDTIIYKLHKPTDDKIKDSIFVYMLSKILSYSISKESLYENNTFFKIIDHYSAVLSNNYDIIKGAYNTLLGTESGTKSATIDLYYGKIVEKYNKIYSFVRIGTRTKVQNPRYKYSEVASNQPAFLKLDYINTDIKNDDIKYTDKPEKYIFGMYDRIYVPDQENKEISEDFFNACLWDKTNEALKNNICVIGIGQSGSGKTSSLISFKNTTTKLTQDGILIEALRNNKFKAKYNKLILTITEIRLDPEKTPENIDAVTDTFYTTEDACVPTTYIIDSKGSWELATPVKDIGVSEKEREAAQDIGQYIVWVMDNKRLIHPTPNNPVSSRSHMVICLTCIPVDLTGEKKNIIFLDLAGNENEFECNKPAVIVKFYEKYMLEKDKLKLKTVFEDIDVGQDCSKDRIDTIKESASTMGEYIINTSASTMEQYILELDKANTNLETLEGHIRSIEEIKKYLEDTIVTKMDKDRSSESLMKYLSGIPMPYLMRYLFGINKDDAKVKQQYDQAKHYIKLLDTLCIEYILKKEYIQKEKELIIIINNGKTKILLDTKTLGKLIDESYSDTDNQFGINNNNYLRTLKDNKKFDIFILLMKQIQVKLNDLLTTKSEPKFDTFDTIREEIKKKIELRKGEIECDKPKLLAIAGECKKRRYEGFMINRSIRDMIKEIKSLMRVKLIRKDEDKKISYMPLCFETQIYENCLDPLKDQKIYDTFYDTPETETNSSKILQTIQGKGVNLLNLDFVVFTVINVSNNTNNPPDPPFININDLIKHTHIIKNDTKMEEAYENVVVKLKKYKFYYPESGQTYIDQIRNIMDNIHTPKRRAEALIEFINNVNQTTLIGTLESSDKLKHYIFNSIPCLITENTTTTPTPPVGGGKRQFIEDRNHMIDQNRRHVSTRRKQLKGSKLTRKSKKEYRYS